jgi:hypothetical protein
MPRPICGYDTSGLMIRDKIQHDGKLFTWTANVQPVSAYCGRKLRFENARAEHMKTSPTGKKGRSARGNRGKERLHGEPSLERLALVRRGPLWMMKGDKDSTRRSCGWPERFNGIRRGLARNEAGRSRRGGSSMGLHFEGVWNLPSDQQFRAFSLDGRRQWGQISIAAM